MVNFALTQSQLIQAASQCDLENQEIQNHGLHKDTVTLPDIIRPIVYTYTVTDSI
jgi:hypothetical protein